MSGDTNVTHHRSTVSGLKVPPEANMSQEEVAVNMIPPNIHVEPPFHDEVMNLHKQTVDGQDRSLSSMSIVGENDNNGLLFAPACSVRPTSTYSAISIAHSLVRSKSHQKQACEQNRTLAGAIKIAPRVLNL